MYTPLRSRFPLRQLSIDDDDDDDDDDEGGARATEQRARFFADISRAREEGPEKLVHLIFRAKVMAAYEMLTAVDARSLPERESLVSPRDHRTLHPADRAKRFT